jgi:hypothetical protein
MFVIPSYVFPSPMYLITYPDFNFTTHQVAVLVHVLDKGPIRWNTGLNTTAYRLKMKDEIEDYSWLYSTQRNNGKMSWTGGWTNRVQVKNFSFGLDLLYLLHRIPPQGNPF